MKKFLVLFFLIIFSAFEAQAYDLVLPKSRQTIVKSEYIFFVGNAKKNETIKINDKNVYIAPNGAFAHSVKLKAGENRILVKSNYQSKLYKFYKSEKDSKTVHYFKELPEEIYLVAKDNTPLRSTPVDFGINRITHLFANTYIIIDGEEGGFYRVRLAKDKYAWIDKSAVVKSSVEQIEPKFIDTNCKAYKNGHNHVIKFSENLPYTIDETDTEIVFKIYNPFVNGNDIYTINVAKTEKYSYKINLKNGEYTLKVNYLIPNKENPLKDLTFLIDAGHGGHENGAIGCFGEKEKNINLEIATELKKLLAEQGAYTVMTRECDAYVSLNDRIKLAQEYAAHIFISIHLNSIGDIDMNIHKHRGVGVFYYNLNSRDLANSVEKTLANSLNLKKDGVHRASFAVIRPTDYIGILVEAAYMTNPLDSMIYRADDFAQNAAKGILEGIINYLSE
ncbi:N-acetylmuramoyl-L-alanine amidase [bacterium]|nr:N-acetylmuramoyl-L-alanine amidase [bacterium]